MEETIHIEENEEEHELFTCSICLGNNIDIQNQCITNCNHKFCLECITTWFNQLTTSCPYCRALISYYDNNGNRNNIISIQNRVRNNNNDNTFQTILQLKNRIYYMNFVIVLSFIYFIYSLYERNALIFQLDNYEGLYSNCTNSLTISNQLINIMESKSSLSTIPVYFNNHLYDCYFPLYYIDKCYLGIQGKH